MSDLNKEALDVWGGLKPMIDQEISSRTQGMVQRRKAKVTTAPSLATNTIGVTEAFGDEMFLPFVSNMISAKVGDFVWIEWMYGATNAFVSSYAAVDDKNVSVAGVLDVVPRRTYATLSSPGWYRVLKHERTSGYPGAEGAIVDIYITRMYYSTDNEVHKITLLCVYNTFRLVDEQSIAKELGIDMIRVTHDSDENVYVDIHYCLSSFNAVSVFFDIHASRQLDGGLIDNAEKWNAEDFRYINNDYVPAGETVFINRSLYRMTQGSGSWNKLGKIWYIKKKSNVVFLDAPGDITSADAGFTTIMTLPEGYRPEVLQRIGPGNNPTAFMFVQIGTDGVVQFYTSTAITSATNASFSTSWPSFPI